MGYKCCVIKEVKLMPNRPHDVNLNNQVYNFDKIF